MRLNPGRIASQMQPLLVLLVVIFVIVNVYGYVTSDEFGDDDDSVTITFSCKQVLGSQDAYPEFVVMQCKQLRSE